jgi:hypothetical protein
MRLALGIYARVRILLHVSAYYYMCPHTTVYVSAYYCICVRILLTLYTFRLTACRARMRLAASICVLLY